ncbi:type II secretion system F family protein [Embleya sp. NPDC055664]
MATVIIAAILGAGFGAGTLVILHALYPPRISLQDALAALHRPPTVAPIAVQEEPGWASRLGRLLVPLLRALGLPTEGVGRDLRVLGRDPERHLAEKAAAGLMGLMLPPVLLGLIELLGIVRTGITLPAVVTVGCFLVMFTVPDLAVRSAAKARRDDMRSALAVVLDLTVVSLAGGAGVDQALRDAAAVPQGWAAAQIRRALSTAAMSRIPPWGPLGRLGGELDVQELRELAAAVALAGAEGARVRKSLAAKAAGLRARQLAEAQAEAVASTERMTLPLTLLFAGFLLFIGFPAMSHVMSGL